MTQLAKSIPRSTTSFFLLLLAISYSSFKVNAQAIDTSFLYRITNTWQEGKSLALAYDGTNNRPILRQTADQPTQYWKIKKDKYGNYRLINYRQGSTYSVELINDAEKNKVKLGDTKDVASQAWKINSIASGIGKYRITCLWIGPEKSLDVVNDGKDNNELTLAATGNVSGQMWKFTKLPKPAQVNPTVSPVIVQPSSTNAIDTEGYYRLSSQWQGEAKVLGISEGDQNKPQLVSKAETLSQYWKLVATSDGFFRIVNQQYTDKCLDVVNDDTDNKLTLTGFGNFSGQLWKLTSSAQADGLYYRLTSMWQGDGKSLDILNDGKNNEPMLSPSGNYAGQSWKLTKQTNLPPSRPVATEVRLNTQNTLKAKEELLPGKKLISTNGKYTLIQQEDGNLVLYNQNNQPLWASGMNGKSVQRCIMQSDGNLVQYLQYNVATWASGTHGHEGAYLELEDSGAAVIFGKDKKRLWSTNTQER